MRQAQRSRGFHLGFFVIYFIGVRRTSDVNYIPSQRQNVGFILSAEGTGSYFASQLIFDDTGSVLEAISPDGSSSPPNILH